MIGIDKKGKQGYLAELTQVTGVLVEWMAREFELNTP